MSEETTHVHVRREGRCTQAAGVSSGVYFFAFVGAAIYYIQHAVGFWDGVLGFLKAIVWPAFLVYKALEFFNL